MHSHVREKKQDSPEEEGLNPCCNGRCTRTEEAVRRQQQALES